MVSMAVPKDGDLHKRLIDQVSSRLSLAEKSANDKHAIWAKAEDTTLGYVHETEYDRLRRNKRDNGVPQYTTIHIPYTYALLMSAHTYWTSVFFARTPIIQVSGRHGETEMQTQAMEALMDYQVQVGEMMGPLYIWLYDAGKYGVGWLGNYWARERTYYSAVDVGMDGKKFLTRMVRDGYSGNRIYNVSPYDMFPDPRVPVNRFQDGEFCAALRRISWSEVKEREALGYYINVDELVKHPKMPPTNKGSSNLDRPVTGTVEEVSDYDEQGKRRTSPAMIAAYEFHVKLVPREWRLGNSEYPEKWCITITYDKGLIIGCEPLGYAHSRFPFDVLETEVEGYGLYNRGLPEIMAPIQETVDWLMNAHFYNVRSSLNNQFVFDPSRVNSRDLESGGPGYAIRLRPEAYGSDVRTVIHQLPVQDITRGNLADMQMMTQWGEKATGINEAIMGAGSAGRKTATEVRTSTNFGVNRLKTISEYMSSTGFGPLSQKLIQNTQQFYDAPKRFKIVGDLAKMAGQKFMLVNPNDIQGFYDFVQVDGSLPVDRFAQVALWKDLLATLRVAPEIAMRYDVAKMFAWVAQLAGLKNINQFEHVQVQVSPDQQIAQQAAAGNIVPMRGAPGGMPPMTSPTTDSSVMAGTRTYGT